MLRTSPIPRLALALGLTLWLVAPVQEVLAQYDGGAGAAPGGAADHKAPANDSGNRWGRAEKSEKEKDEAKAAAARTVGRRTARFLVKARDFMVAEKYDDAIAVLNRINLKRLNPYERALVYRNQGYLAYFKQDYANAVTLLRKALDEGSLTAADHNDILFSIAQVYATSEKWQESVNTYKEWFATQEKPSPNGHFQLAVVYYRMSTLEGTSEEAKKQALDNALTEAKTAIDIAENPQQSWLQLLLNLQLQKQDYAGATPVLVTLLTRYPHIGKNYWLQLATLYGVQDQKERALAILQLAHRLNYVTEDRDLRRLAGLLQTNDIPIRAAKVLNEGLEQKHIVEDSQAYELLGNSWIMARESDKAEPALRRAAQLSKDGGLSMRLGQVLLLKDDNEGAAVALKEALAKGGIDDPGNVELLLGITYYNLGKLGESRSWFVKSRRSAKAKVTADAWIQHIDEEIAKQNGGAAPAAEPVAQAEPRAPAR